MTDYFLSELTKWGETQSEADRGRKAHRIYVRCLLRKKIALANAIKNKYGSSFPRPDDATIAIGFAIMAAKGGAAELGFSL